MARWTLKPGERGTRVVVMQRALRSNSFDDASGGRFYTGAIDGVYGPATRAAVKKAKHALGYSRVNDRGGWLLLAYLQKRRKLPAAMRRRRVERIKEQSPQRTIVKPRWSFRYPRVPWRARRRYLIEHYSASPRSTTAATIHAWHRVSMSGIGYTWVIEEDGTIVEGRGPGYIGAHTMGWNREWAVCVPGDNSQPPSDAQVASLKWLRQYADALNGRPLLHRQHRDMPGNSTSCAGKFWPWVR